LNSSLKRSQLPSPLKSDSTPLLAGKDPQGFPNPQFYPIPPFDPFQSTSLI